MEWANKPGRRSNIEWNGSSNVAETKTTTKQEMKKKKQHTLKQMTILYEYGNAPRSNEPKHKKNYMRIAFLASWILLACLATEWYTRNSLALTASTIATATHKKKTHTERFKPRAVFGFWVFRFMFNLLRVVFFFASFLFLTQLNAGTAAGLYSDRSFC